MTSRTEWVAEARRADMMEVAGRLGAKLRRQGREFVGPCPLCGGKSDKLAIHPQKRVFNCGHDNGAGGDVIDLVCHVLDYDRSSGFLAACEWINGTPPPDGAETETPEQRQYREQRAEERRRELALEGARSKAAADKFRAKERKRAYELWMSGLPIQGTHAERYLVARGILHHQGLRLRFMPAATYWVWSKKRKSFISAGAFPVMTAAIVGPDGRFAALHQTFLDPTEPCKAVIADPVTGETHDADGRLLYPSKKVRGPRGAGVIHLTRACGQADADVGEGIETTASVRDAMIDEGRAVDGILWVVAVSLGNIGGPAAESVPHPLGLKRPDARGRMRSVRIPGPEPDWKEPGMVLPPTVRRALILCDGDSDRATVDFATLRGAARFARAGVDTLRAWPTAGLDFNDMRRAEIATRNGVAS